MAVKYRHSMFVWLVQLFWFVLQVLYCHLFKLIFVILVTVELCIICSSLFKEWQTPAQCPLGGWTLVLRRGMVQPWASHMYWQERRVSYEVRVPYPDTLNCQAHIDYSAALLSVIFLLSFLSNSAIITTINHDEVWFKRVDGSKSKLYISQLQKGKYTIKHAWSTWDLIRCQCGSLKCLIVPFYVQYIMI